MRKPFWIAAAAVAALIVGGIAYDQVRLQVDPAYAAQRQAEIDARVALEKENEAQEKLKQASLARSRQNEKWESEHAKWDAALMSQKFIEPRLKAPASAKFQDFSDAAVAHMGGGVYTVSSYVDSQNGFGAMLRTHYTCRLQDKGDGKWHLVNLKIGE